MRDIGTATEGRYIGGGRDKSAPTDVQVILLNAIIGGGHDKSAPTEGRIRLLNAIIAFDIT